MAHPDTTHQHLLGSGSFGAAAAFTLACLPWFAAYLAAPAAVLAGKLTGKAALYRPFGFTGLAPWLVLAGVALALSLAAGALRRRGRQKPVWPALALGLLLAAAAWAAARTLPPALAEGWLAPLLDELRLPALALFAGLWIWCFGAPARLTIALLGALLGAAVVIDFLLTAITARSVVLGGGMLFGEDALTADLLAFLLCLALCATLDDQPDPGRPRLARWLILAGILAAFSRAGLAAAAVLCLFMERGPFRPRLGAAMACALCLWMSLTLPLPRFADRGELTLDWYAQATYEALRQEPRALLTGLPLDTPMALAMPDYQGLEWDAEAEGMPVSVFEIPSSGLRLLAAWGIWGPITFLAACAACALRGRSRYALGVCIASAPAFALTPALHVPVTAATLALALFCAGRPGKGVEAGEPADAQAAPE